MKVAVVQGVLPTSLTTVDLTDAVFSSDVEAALCTLTAATANDTSTANAKFSIGAAANDGSASQFTSGVATQDNVATSNSGAQFFTDKIYTVGTTAGTAASDGEGTLSFLSTGVRITVDDADAALLVNCLLIGGSDVEAEIGLAQYPGASTNDVTIAHGLGGTPDLAIIVGAITTTTTTNARVGIGFWGRTVPGETGYSWLSSDGAAAGDVTAFASSTVAIPSITNNVSADVQSADATNFVVRGTTLFTDYIRVLFLRGVSSQIEARVGNFLSETGTGTDDQIAGFTLPIQAGVLIGTQLASVGSSTTVPASTLSLGLFANNAGTIQQGAALVSDEEGADPTNANSVTSNTAAQVLDNDGVIDYVAALTVLDTEATFDTTNADTAENQYLYLAFGAASGAAPTFTAAPAIGTRTTSAIPITFTSDSDGTVYGVRMTDGSTTPTCDAIEAQTVTGGLTYFSEVVVATVGDTEQFGSLTSGTVVDLAFCIESAGGDSAVATIANAYKLPAFTTDITIASQTASAYTTNSKTLDGAGTVTLVACAKDATPPTVAQVNAATGGCILYSQTDDATGAMTLTIGGTPRPLHDLYWTGTYGSQVEAAVHSALDEFLDPPSGYSTWLTLASIGAGSFCEAFNTAVTPDLVAGDIIGIPSTVSPGGFTLFNDNTCQVAYDPVGDFSRQSALNWLVYDVSAAAYHASDIDAWFYTEDPNCSAPFNRVILTDTALSAAPNLGNIDILGGCTHPLGDTLTITQTAGTLPTGLTLTTGVISGTVAGANEDEDGAVQEFTATSAVDGTSTTQDATLFPWTTLALFDCTTGPETQGDCENSINAQFLSTLTINISSVCDQSVTAGYVVSQAPAAMAEVAPYTTVDLVVSGGCRRQMLLLEAQGER